MHIMKSETKKPYFTPEIEKIAIDNEISLALESTVTPPKAPGEAYLNEHFSENPFKITNC